MLYCWVIWVISECAPSKGREETPIYIGVDVWWLLWSLVVIQKYKMKLKLKVKIWSSIRRRGTLWFAANTPWAQRTGRLATHKQPLNYPRSGEINMHTNTVTIIIIIILRIWNILSYVPDRNMCFLAWEYAPRSLFKGWCAACSKMTCGVRWEHMCTHARLGGKSGPLWQLWSGDEADTVYRFASV